MSYNTLAYSLDMRAATLRQNADAAYGAYEDTAYGVYEDVDAAYRVYEKRHSSSTADS